MQAAQRTDRGLIRARNEDCCAVLDLGDGVTLCVVCDGMGGAVGGEIASATALEAFGASMRAAFERGIPRGDAEIDRALRRACTDANRAVYLKAASGKGELYGMGTTLVALLIRERSFGFVLSVGDSRAYEITPAGARQITHDHSLVQYLVDTGRMTAEAAAVSPRRNIITRAVGIDAQVEPDVFLVDPVPLEGEHRVFLLCSDGLHDMISDREIASIAGSSPTPDECVEALVRAAKEAGGRDNVTAVAVQF